MGLSSIQHIEPGQLLEFEADLFITALDLESRCTTIARKFEKKSCRKIALVQTDQLKEFSYDENNAYFTDQGFEIISVESKVPDFGVLFSMFQEDTIRVILDCTCMSPRWYHEFFNWFDENQDEYSEVSLRMVYTMAGFKDHERILKVKSVKSFLKKEYEGTQKKKSALILGLGYEKEVSKEIYNKIKPDILYLFYADPPVDKKFVEKVFVNNHAMINSIPIRNLITYPIRNGQIIYQTLIDTILPLRNEYTIIVVPHGPKIFAAVSMLVHLGYPDIQVSYPKFKKSPAINEIPCDEPVVLDILFEGEE